MVEEDRKPFISVIIPVYNGASVVQECLNSILKQDFKDFELLIIDDGSTDDTFKICTRISSNDTRIKVFHKKNGGVSSARNFGLRKALGDWIAFIDADDYVFPAYLSDLVEKIHADNSLIISNYGSKNHSDLIKEDLDLSQGDMVEYLFSHHVFNLSAPYGKLYNRRTIVSNKIYFPEGIHMGEDLLFMLDYINSVDSISTSSKALYRVNNTEGSLSKGYYSFESELKAFTKLRESIGKIATKYNLYDDPIKLIWESRCSDTFRRVMRCQFYNGTKASIIQQSLLLYSIPMSYIREFRAYYLPDTQKRSILKPIVGHRLFLLYLLIGKIFLRKK